MCDDQRFANRLLIVDNQSEMAAVIGGLSAALLQGDELVAQIDEGRSIALAAKLEFEQSPVKGQGLFDVSDFERYWLKPTARAFLASTMALSSNS